MPIKEQRTPTPSRVIGNILLGVSALFLIHRQAIDREVKEIVETAHQQALDTLKLNRDLLEEIATQLLETEVIEGEKLHSLLKQVQTVNN